MAALSICSAFISVTSSQARLSSFSSVPPLQRNVQGSKTPPTSTARAAMAVTGTRIGMDETPVVLLEAMDIARAAAEAARDAAAFAEAQAVAYSFLDFPSEQDLLLLERARLTEMARSDELALSATKEWESLSQQDGREGEELGQVTESLAQQEDNLAEQSGLVAVAVRSSRKRERLLKRERALIKADAAAASIPTPSPSKSKRSETSYDISDPVRAYLRDVGKSKLLTSAEEIELAEGIQDLLKLENVKTSLTEQIGREPSLLEWATAVGTDRHSLDQRVKSGHACKDKMVISNLRLVVSIAKKYQGRGMTFQDLIQEGSMGLIRGAEKFDHTRGFKFSTYAHWWIRQAITRAIADQSRTIRLPVHVYELLSRINKAKSMLASEHGRPPRNDEVAELVGLSVDKLEMVVKSARPPKSMEFPLGRDNETTLGEVVPDKHAESAEDTISKRLLKQDLDTVLHTLSPRERAVLRLRYGLDDGRVKTLEEIGTVFRVTRERIRQIESKAMLKLRQPNRNRPLREYLDL